MAAKKHRKLSKLSVPEKSMPLDIGMIHFVGIGGIGMSGIAEILHNLGYQVCGSDASESYNIDRLRKKGIKVFIGQKAENIKNVAVVVKSTAVPLDNPEIKAAMEKHIPVVRRSEMLAELTGLKATVAVAGSHGKTTTTSLVATMLASAGLDPTVINGGIINSYGTNAYLGKGDWMVAEADESDGTFIKIPATVGIITNIDPEHLDYWKNFKALKEGFRTFIENLPFYGFGVLCDDHKEVRKIAAGITNRRIITYGITSKNADITATNIRSSVDGSHFDVKISENVLGKAKTIKNVFLPTPGRHNVLNSLAAIAVAVELKIKDSAIVSAFSNFSGVKRRFTKTGIVGGVTIIDDYGHHPKEIEATLNTARDVVGKKNKVIAVVQPHRYTRLKNLFSDFCKCFHAADKVIVADVYSAGEKPIKGYDKASLVAGINKNKGDAVALSSPDKLAETIGNIARRGDIVVCLGAGSITYWANDLPKQLKKIKK